MSSFSSLSSSPSPSSHQPRTDDGHGSRPCTPRIRTNTSQAFRHPRRPSSPASGSMTRFLDWGQHDCLPSTPKRPVFARRSPALGSPGHAPTRVSAQPPPSSSRAGSQASAGSFCNEVSPVSRVGGLGRRMSAIQAHQFEHAPTERTTRVSSLALGQVAGDPLNQAPSLSSSLTSAPSFIAPPTPQSQASPVRLRSQRHSAFVTPSLSSSSLRSEARSCAHVKARCEPSSPSPAPRSHAPHESNPGSRSSPLASPQPFTIRRGLVPPRARPTLAMSLQVHAPTPVMSTMPMSPTLPPATRPRSRSRPPSSSRPSSPLTSSVPLPPRPPMTRPPSRSERLLRDTLRRAEEQERVIKSKPAPSFSLAPAAPTSHIPPSVAEMFATCRLPAAAQGGRRHRRNTSASVQSESSCDYFEGEPLDEDSQEDEEDSGWLWRANSAGSLSSMSSGHGYGHAYYPARAGHSRQADSNPYGTPASPSPARTQLQRAAKSSPAVPRRHSHSQSVSHVPAHPPARTSVDGERPACACHQPGAPLTPHEAVLRSRLEGVLKGAATGGSRRRSSERKDAEQGLSSGSGNSMASSRNLSGEGDFFFGASSDPSLTSLSSNESKPKASMPSSPRRAHLHLPPSTPPSRYSQRQPSSQAQHKGGVSPLTPPPSPPFNVRQAAAQVKGMDGYISFANIEGLGMPDGTDDDSEEDAKSRSRWFHWLNPGVGKSAVAGDRSRGRSESSSSASR